MADEIVRVFESSEFGNVRTALGENGEPLFCAKDVATALGYKDTKNAVKQHCRGVAIHHPIKDGLGREQQARFITEGDMYRLIASSKLEGAVRFESWVFDEVIPSIRRHGMYATPQAVERMLQDPDTMIRTLQELKAARERADALRAENERILPKAVAYDSFMDGEGTYSIQTAARYVAQVDPRMTGKRLYALLRADGLVCKQSRCPTKRAIDRGLAKQMMAKKRNGEDAAPYVHLTKKGLDWCIANYAARPIV
jgi:prophage antirepressor-like protein